MVTRALRPISPGSSTVGRSRRSCAHRCESIRCQTGYEGLDEVEITLANDSLRWLDCPLFKLDASFTLKLGYAPDPLIQVFDGEVVARGASFPSGGTPTVSITAHDRRHKMQ